MIMVVDKQRAKDIIDNAPGDKVLIICVDQTTLVHEQPERKEKKYGKELVDIAKNVFYDETEVFGVLSLKGELVNNQDDILRNIMFAKLE